MGLRHLVLPIMLFVPFSAANAQHPLVLDRLNAWNRAAPAPDNAVMQAEVRKKAAAIYGTAPACAASETTIEKVEPASADRFAFNALVRGTIRNAWFVTARTPGCDTAPVRYMVTQANDDSLSTIRVNRGVSHAWESLLGDTLPSVQVAAFAALKRSGLGCDTKNAPPLGVIRVASEEPGLGANVFGVRYSGSWSEVWPISACGHAAEITIEFRADGDGGAYTNIPGSRIRVLP